MLTLDGIKKTDLMAFSPASFPAWLRSGKTPGLCLKVSKLKKTWIFEKRWNGSHHKLALGDFPDVSIDLARSSAQKISSSLQLTGELPSEYFRLNDLWHFYWSRHGRFKKSAREDARLFKQFFSSWSSKNLTHINRASVARLHNEVGLTSPYSANRMLALLRSIFNRSIEWGLLEPGQNPCVAIKNFREKKRKRYLSSDELQHFLGSVQQEKNQFWRAYFLLSLLLGQRKSELLSARWSDIHWGAGLWRLPETKCGNPHEVPLPAEAISVLKSLPRSSVFIFPGSGKSGHLANPYKAWAALKNRAALPTLRIHDLRRSLATFLLNQGESIITIQKLLNHQSVRTTEIYIGMNSAPVRSALSNASALICSNEGKKENSKILKMGGRKK